MPLTAFQIWHQQETLTKVNCDSLLLRVQNSQTLLLFHPCEIISDYDLMISGQQCVTIISAWRHRIQKSLQVVIFYLLGELLKLAGLESRERVLQELELRRIQRIFT